MNHHLLKIFFGTLLGIGMFAQTAFAIPSISATVTAIDTILDATITVSTTEVPDGTPVTVAFNEWGGETASCEIHSNTCALRHWVTIWELESKVWVSVTVDGVEYKNTADVPTPTLKVTATPPDAAGNSTLTVTTTDTADGVEVTIEINDENSIYVSYLYNGECTIAENVCTVTTHAAAGYKVSAYIAYASWPWPDPPSTIIVPSGAVGSTAIPVLPWPFLLLLTGGLVFAASRRKLRKAA